jgi:predicted DNA binding CopG/RHH family protein
MVEDRTAYLNFRIRPRALARLKQRADEAGLRLSEYVRKLLDAE